MIKYSGQFETIGNLIELSNYLFLEGNKADASVLANIANELIDNSIDNDIDASFEEHLNNEDSLVLSTEDDLDAIFKDDDLEDFQEVEANEVNAQRPKRIPRSQWRKIFRRRKPKRKIYLCASRPKKKRTARGRIIWYSMVKYRASGKVRMMFRVVGRDPAKRPQKVIMKGKKLRWC